MNNARHDARTTNQSKDVTLEPLNSIFDKRYSVYCQVLQEFCKR